MRCFSIHPASASTYLIAVICEVAFIILAIFLYCLYFKPVNKTVAVFVYLMVYVITLLPSSLPSMSADSGNVVQILGESLLILFLGYIFYRFVIVSISRVAQMEVSIGRRAYIVLPVFSLAYTLIMETINSIYQADTQLLAVVSIASIFVILAVCIGFHYIIQNTIVIYELERARDDVKTLSLGVMEALANTIDAKDEYTKGHSIRVAKYSRMIATKMGLPEKDQEMIYYMGLLHDIGKIGVPNEIINKPDRLSDEEYNIVKLHPIIGYNILREIRNYPYLSMGARWHHERYDGKGYPDGKGGEEIPLLDRIITVADSYDAMTSNRSYRNYMPQEAVRKELKKNMGTQFDPEVAKCMIDLIDADTEYLMHE